MSYGAGKSASTWLPLGQNVSAQNCSADLNPSYEITQRHGGIAFWRTRSLHRSSLLVMLLFCGQLPLNLWIWYPLDGKRMGQHRYHQTSLMHLGAFVHNLLSLWVTVHSGSEWLSQRSRTKWITNEKFYVHCSRFTKGLYYDRNSLRNQSYLCLDG